MKFRINYWPFETKRFQKLEFKHLELIEIYKNFLVEKNDDVLLSKFGFINRSNLEDEINFNGIWMRAQALE